MQAIQAIQAIQATIQAILGHAHQLSFETRKPNRPPQLSPARPQPAQYTQIHPTRHTFTPHSLTNTLFTLNSKPGRLRKLLLSLDPADFLNHT